MKAFLDTNVILAAFLTQGVCSDLFRRAVAVEFEALVSDQVLQETKKHLQGKFGVPQPEVERTLELIRGTCLVVPLPPSVSKVSRDPDDDAILAAAATAKSEYLVTGDKDLLVLRKHEGMEILTPAAFVRCIESQKRGS